MQSKNNDSTNTMSSSQSLNSRLKVGFKVNTKFKFASLLTTRGFQDLTLF